ncbi:acyl-homoserine-lactone synthase TraI [Rhizobium sp. BK251]|uniref:acyl-homoserine-lactone synthase n=1 Tax=Rhizobium sp. BK251 TaxID=2512125 RepID=UPI0010530092|nr:acyl-homoserine-lactone synthase TraI [Rhizobium sp. BK251]TCL63648.1 acyl homoserine lactone synthase [Rhizobium sp. BK251]
MRLQAIRKPTTTSERRLIDQMHELRARIFRDRLGWSVQCIGDREYDAFDELDPTYILAISSQDSVVGCARLLPATGRTMLEDVFPQLLRDGGLSAHEAMIESSRFCADTGNAQGREGGTVNDITLWMFAGIVDWCRARGYTEIATATDVRLERILRRIGWPMRRIGDAIMINETRSVAGVLPADEASFARLRPNAYRSDFACLQMHAA